MQALQNRDLLSSDTNAMDQLHAFLRQRREAHEPVENLDAFEQERHRLFVTAEREALSQEMDRGEMALRISARQRQGRQRGRHAGRLNITCCSLSDPCRQSKTPHPL